MSGAYILHAERLQQKFKLVPIAKVEEQFITIQPQFIKNKISQSVFLTASARVKFLLKHLWVQTQITSPLHLNIGTMNSNKARTKGVYCKKGE